MCTNSVLSDWPCLITVRVFVQMELSQSSTRLTEKITQMENFISNLEEIFITVEVTLWMWRNDEDQTPS